MLTLCVVAGMFMSEAHTHLFGVRLSVLACSYEYLVAKCLSCTEVVDCFTSASALCQNCMLHTGVGLWYSTFFGVGWSGSSEWNTCFGVVKKKGRTCAGLIGAEGIGRKPTLSSFGVKYCTTVSLTRTAYRGGKELTLRS